MDINIDRKNDQPWTTATKNSGSGKKCWRIHCNSLFSRLFCGGDDQGTGVNHPEAPFGWRACAAALRDAPRGETCNEFRPSHRNIKEAIRLTTSNLLSASAFPHTNADAIPQNASLENRAKTPVPGRKTFIAATETGKKL